MQTSKKNNTPDNGSDDGWSKVPYKIYPQTARHRPPYIKKKTNSNEVIHYRPVKRYWIGFDLEGNENWVLEMENGNLISHKDSYYSYLVKKYYSNENIR